MDLSSWQRTRAAFLTGVLVTVPLGVTVFVLWFLVTWVDGLQPGRLIGLPAVPGLGIVLVLSGILAVGVAAQNLAGRRLIVAYERLIERVPILSSVYGGVKQVVEAALAQGTSSVKGVVLVQWPREGVWSIAFHTGDGWIRGPNDERFVNVFVPSTPNPTTGFYFLTRETELVATDLSVEDAAKLLMSAGIVGSHRRVTVPTARGPLEVAAPAPPR